MLPPRVRPCPRPLRLVCACRVARASVTTIHVCLRSLNVAFNEMVNHSSLWSLNIHLAKSVTSPHSAPLAVDPAESWLPLVSPYRATLCPSAGSCLTIGRGGSCGGGTRPRRARRIPLATIQNPCCQGDTIPLPAAAARGGLIRIEGVWSFPPHHYTMFTLPRTSVLFLFTMPKFVGYR